MNVNAADVGFPLGEEIAQAIAEIAAMEQSEFEALFRPSKYQRRIDELYSKALGGRLLAETTSDAMFTQKEQTEFKDLMDEEAKRALEAERGAQYRTLLSEQMRRLRELDARTRVLPLIFWRIRNAFLCEPMANEVTVLIAALLHATRGWRGSEVETTMRVLAAVGKLANGCIALRGDGDSARDTLRRIIALEIEDDEGPYRASGLYEFWNEQLNMVYSADEARRYSTEAYIEKDRKFVQRERERAQQVSSPDK